MNARIKPALTRLFSRSCLVAFPRFALGRSTPAASLMLAALISAITSAQTFETLYSFDPNSGATHPTNGPLVDIDSTLYGTMQLAHSSNGAVYGLSEDGSTFFSISVPVRNGFPSQGDTLNLTYSGSSLYGFVEGVGSAPPGVLFSTNQNSGFQVLHTWTTGNGVAAVTPIGSQLYGTTSFSDVANSPPFKGEVFAMNPDGSNFQVIHSFPFSVGSPTGTLIQSGNTLYGFTNGLLGEVYSMNLDGSNFQVLHTFGASGQGNSPIGLTLVGTTLYGTTYSGGSSNLDGTIFSMNLNGSNFQVLHSFTGPDGSNPSTGLTLLGSELYGTALNTTGTLGGTNAGTIFSINLDGSGFQVIYAFTSSNGNVNPTVNPGALIAEGNTLYGMTGDGGSFGYGSVFAVSVPEPSALILALVGLAILAYRRCFVVRSPLIETSRIPVLWRR
jgi:uncharacterized repeat protein (TIGR03803 family)